MKLQKRGKKIILTAAGILFAVLGLGYKSSHNNTAPAGMAPGVSEAGNTHYEKLVKNKKTYEQLGDEYLQKIGFGKRSFDRGDEESAQAIMMTEDGGYVAAGYTKPDAKNRDLCWIIRIDQSGNKQWEKTLGGKKKDYRASAITAAADGGFAIAGTVRSKTDGSSSYFLIKFDSSGKKQWEKTFSEGQNNTAYSIDRTGDGGYIIAGLTQPAGKGHNSTVNMYIVKTDESGGMQWDTKIGKESRKDFAYMVIQAGDGGYVIAGSREKNGKKTFCLLKLDQAGVPQWDKRFEGKRGAAAKAVMQRKDGGFVAAGYIQNYGSSGKNIWVMGFDASGNREWESQFGGQYDQEAGAVIQEKAGGFIVAGNDGNKAWIIELNQEGKEEGERVFDKTECTGANAILETPSRSYIICGDCFVTYKNTDGCIVNFNLENFYEKAAEYYKKAGKEKLGYTKIAELYLKNKNIKKAVEYYKKAEDHQGLKKIADIYFSKKKYSDAVKLYKATNDVDMVKQCYKIFGDKYKALADKDFMKKSYKRCIENYEYALKCYKKAGIDYTKKTYARFALAYEKENEIVKAISAYKEAGNLKKARQLQIDNDADRIVKRMYLGKSLQDVIGFYENHRDDDLLIIIVKAAKKNALDSAETAVLIQNTKETRRIAQRYTQIANKLDLYLKKHARNKR